MPSFNPRASPVSQAICCELVVCSHSGEKPNTEDKQVASCNMKDTVDATSEGIIISPIDEKPGVVVPVTELDDGETVDCQVCYGQISVPNATSDQDDTLVSNEINMCKEFSQPLSLDGNVHKCLSKSKTFPVSRVVQAYSSSTNGRADSPGAEEQGQNSSASGTSAYLRSISLPVSFSYLCNSIKCLSYLLFYHVIPLRLVFFCVSGGTYSYGWCFDIIVRYYEAVVKSELLKVHLLIFFSVPFTAFVS